MLTSAGLWPVRFSRAFSTAHSAVATADNLLCAAIDDTIGIVDSGQLISL